MNQEEEKKYWRDVLGITLKRKKAYLKRQARRRVLEGFSPLNNSFVNSEGHHINKNEVIYIPKKLHKSIYHNVFTGKNMEKINALAFNFLKQQEEARLRIEVRSQVFIMEYF